MILAMDAHYRADSAKFVALCFHDWADALPHSVHALSLPLAGEYVPGEFYKRELPGLLELLKQVDLAALQCIVVDGYVWLDDDGRPGLGWHLYESLGRRVPVIGVAKSYFHQNEKHVAPVLRGQSAKPLYLTSIGIDLAAAAASVKNMHGPYRMPTLLALLDRQTKVVD